MRQAVAEHYRTRRYRALHLALRRKAFIYAHCAVRPPNLVDRMASTVQVATYNQAPPLLVRNEHSSLNGSFPQSQYKSFDTSQSVVSTPAATPPPQRAPLQHQMSYNMGGGPVMNGMTQRSSFGAYPDINGYSQPQYYTNGMKPQIYTVSDR